MGHLPDEVLLMILRHADGDTVCSASCASKQLSRLGAQALIELRVKLGKALKSFREANFDMVHAIEFFTDINFIDADSKRVKSEVQAIARSYKRCHMVSSLLYQRVFERRRDHVEKLIEIVSDLAELLFQCLVIARETQTPSRQVEHWQSMERASAYAFDLSGNPDKLGDALSDFERKRLAIHRQFGYGDEWQKCCGNIQRSMSRGGSFRGYLSDLRQTLFVRREGQYGLLERSWQEIRRQVGKSLFGSAKASIYQVNGLLSEVQEHLQKVEELRDKQHASVDNSQCST